MYVFNITFVMAPQQEQAFIRWMNDSGMPSIRTGGWGAGGMRLMKVEETGGEKPGPEHGLSMALHVEFDSIENAHGWNDGVLPGVLQGFHKEFGPHVAFFTTLLEVIAL